MNYEIIGQQSLERFVDTVRTVINDGEFSLVLAASDSGNLATYITSVVYEYTGHEMPPASVFPVFRHVDTERTILFDNAISAPNYASLKDVNIDRVLFVDDEIWHGNTLRGVLDILKALNTTMDTLTVVAEDGGFNPCALEEAYGIRICFVSPGDRVEEVYNAFSYIVPDRFVEAMRGSVSDGKDINYKQIMCTLLGIPIKERSNGVPYFSHRLLDEAQEKIDNFESLQHSYAEWFNHQIINALGSTALRSDE